MTIGTGDNPYVAPSAPLDDLAPRIGVSREAAPPSAIFLMRQTLPWVTLLAVMSLIFTIGLPMFASFKDIVGPEAGATPARMQVGGTAVLYIPAAWYLWRFTSGIRRLLRERDVAALDEALANQKSLYKFLSLLLAVIFSIFLLSLLRGALR